MDVDDIIHWRGSLSAAEPCPYLPDREWENFVLNPGEGMAESVHEHLLETGFRRMGSMFFQPVCHGCQECRPMRVDIQTFKPGRSLRKSQNRNLDLTISYGVPEYTEEKRELLGRYLTSRHTGPMVAEENSVRDYMFSGSVRGREMEYRLDGQLIGVGLIDQLSNIVSSLYFFFDPDHAKRSLGIASMMFEIDLAREAGCQWYHPGFFIKDCPAMSYKARFGPAEILSPEGEWRSSDATS